MNHITTKSVQVSYWCGKCDKDHRLASKIGKDHTKYSHGDDGAGYKLIKRCK